MAKLPKHEQQSSETSELAALYVLGCLSEAERAEFETHLKEDCVICNTEISRFGADFAALAEASSADIPSDMRERFVVLAKNARQTHSVARGLVFNASGVLVVRTGAMDWKAGTVPGIRAKILFVDEPRQRITSLVSMEPGAHYAQHRHHGPEELFLLSGDLIIEGQKVEAGDYCRAEPGSIHSESHTESGCLFVLVASQLDEVLSSPSG
jgi:anti-sigma factor ChrR (cupin superfamily)